MAKRVGWAPLALAGLALLLMWRVVLGGQVFVPAALLRYAAPWSSLPSADPLPTWNPLLYDSVGQFYPWRHFASETLRGGLLPLWNPYAFCGTPFVANSQSAVFYPLNVIYWVLPTATAAGLSAILHLLLAGAFMWLLVKRVAQSNSGGFVAGFAFMLSGWELAWLHLPTLLATSCWIPIGVLLALRLVERPTVSRAAGLAACIGMMLLAGHLQIAFYGAIAVLVAGAFALWQQKRARVRGALLFASALVLGAMLASPQVVPALELSRYSHRAAKPTAAGYAAYTAYAVGRGQLATLLVPGFLGEPASGDLQYRGLSKGGAYFNYAEGALYVGVTTLLLAGFAFLRRRRDSAPPERQTVAGAGMFAVLGALALLMAFATPLDAILYFHGPGFGQSGSPGRALVLWAFAVSGLAGIGAARLLRGEVAVRSAAFVAVSAAALLGATYLAGSSAPVVPGTDDLGLYTQDLPRQVIMVVLAIVAVIAVVKRPRFPGVRAFPAALVVVDLLAAGVNLNPTAPRGAVYPVTPLIARLREVSGHDRIMPVNHGWSFAGPKAVLPPNGALVFGLRDVQGYDSLFPGQYKQWMNRLAGRDSSPPEVGNMVFARDPLSAMAPLLGVRCVVSREPIPELPGAGEEIDGAYIYDLPNWPGRVRLEPPGSLLRVQWIEDGPTRAQFRVATPPGRVVLADQWFPGWHSWVDGVERRIDRADGIFRSVDVDEGEHTVRFAYQPQGFRVGLFLALVALAVVLGVGTWVLGVRGRGAHGSLSAC